MKNTFILLAGIAAGLLLASRASRRTFKKLSEKADRAWKDPNVQRAISQTEQAAKDAKAAAESTVSTLVDQASSVVDTAREQVTKVSKKAQAQVADAVDAATEAVERQSDTN
ncbi:YtxH domain-containing protein [Cryobacterium sp. CG_9.6]|uniref:YtxH domain-containing protein n=1 Tax=Cryobacterium sp. CG_9.6 TaxID=2760710 RepID=UPI0024748D16|nr:YtxH domain-containing protein [Cryobacterium sp. CG_9.6]MDH6235470.1 gas vesicle protein [Cryobacterium sp. CG_9.6]